MQHETAQNLRKQWGKKPCHHPFTEKEYFLGSDTGDKVCTTCGRVVDRSNLIKNVSKTKD